jgi:hypothetical protein
MSILFAKIRKVKKEEMKGKLFIKKTPQLVKRTT